MWSKLTKFWLKKGTITAELRLIFTKISTTITPYKKQIFKNLF